MEAKDIDKTHIIVLKDFNGLLSTVEIPIERPTQFIAELEAMVSEPQPYIINISPMSTYERNRLAAYPTEIPILFKVEKITGALTFLKSLKEIAKEVEAINEYIDQLYELNLSLKPEISLAISNIEVKVNEHTRTKEDLDEELKNLAARLKPYEDEMDKLIGNLKVGEIWDRLAYEKANPTYVQLNNEKSVVSAKLAKVNSLIYDLKSFINILEKSKVQLENLKEVA